MLKWGFFVSLMLHCRLGESSYTREYCSNVQFDFNSPYSALADFQACSDLEPRKYPTELTQRFAIGWAKFAAEKGLGEAFRALNNRKVRKILIPNEEWNGIVSRSTMMDWQLFTSEMGTKIKFGLVVVLVLLIMSIAYLARVASDLADALAC